MSNRATEFQEIYAEFQPKLHRYFVRVVGERDAEDLTQEAMIKVSRGLDGFRGESSLSTWIYSIATNVARDRFRSSAHKTGAITGTGDEEEMPDLLEDSRSPAGTLEHITVRKEMNA